MGCCESRDTSKGSKDEPQQYIRYSVVKEDFDLDRFNPHKAKPKLQSQITDYDRKKNTTTNKRELKSRPVKDVGANPGEKKR